MHANNPRETYQSASHACAAVVIDQAARIAREMRPLFVLFMSLGRAASVLAERVTLELSPEQMSCFLAALEAPLPEPAALRKLLARTPR